MKKNNPTKKIDDMINAWAKDSDKGYRASLNKKATAEQFHEYVAQLIEAHKKKVDEDETVL